MMRLSLTYKGPAFLFLICFLCLIPFKTMAQVVVTQTQALNFGVFSFVNFNAILSINIQNNGSNNSNNVVILTPPTRGEFSLTGGPGNSVYTVTTPTNFTLSGPGGNFIIDNIRVRPNTLRTDGAGSDDFTIAARLRSLSGGIGYNSGSYNNTFDITIAF